ncbi:MAG: hypothetical protein HY053_08615, partial [Proteobacteria bacterium]|nr:hypothetical protein [Pseudomonadota bacterium]
MPDTNPNRFVLWSAHTHPADFVPKEGQIVFLSWESGTPNILFGSLLLPLRQAPPTKGFHQVATLTEGRFMKLVGEGEPPTEENFEAQT